MARLWLEVLRLAVHDLHHGNGHSEDARAWLQDPAGAQRVLLGMGYSPQRAQAALQHAMAHPPDPDTDL